MNRTNQAQTKQQPRAGNRQGPTPVKCNQFDITRYSHTDLVQDNERTKTQNISYPRYDYPNTGTSSFIFQTGEINLTQYGLPKLGDFYKNDNERNFIKIPFDPEQESCRQLETMLSSIDEYVQNNNLTLLGSMAGPQGKFLKLFKYQPIVRDPPEIDETAEEDEANADKKKYPDRERFKYAKFKLNVTYPEQKICTTFFIKSADPTSTDAPREERIETASQLEEYVRWGSKIRCIVMANKFWAAKSKNATGTRPYGVSFKILQMQIIPREVMGSVSKVFATYAFDNDDGEVEVAQPQTTKTPKAITSGKAASDLDNEGNELLSDNDDNNNDDSGDNQEQNADADADASGSDNDDNTDNDDPDPVPEPPRKSVKAKTPAVAANSKKPAAQPKKAPTARR